MYFIVSRFILLLCLIQLTPILAYSKFTKKVEGVGFPSPNSFSRILKSKFDIIQKRWDFKETNKYKLEATFFNVDVKSVPNTMTYNGPKSTYLFKKEHIKYVNWGVPLTFVAYGILFWDWGKVSGFRTRDEGWFGGNTYAGGTDKLAHMYSHYLINQFLDSKTNLRQDEYGGNLENRARLLFEVLEQVSKVYPLTRIGVRLSPNGVFNDMGGSDFRELYDFVIAKLSKLNLGYLHVMDGLAFGFHEQGEPYTLKDVRKLYQGIVIGNCGYDADKANVAIKEGLADLVAFGRPYITNPDLPERIKNASPLTPWDDMTYWYGGGAKGYTDYPVYSANQ